MPQKSVMTSFVFLALTSLLFGCATSEKEVIMNKPIPESVTVDNKKLSLKGQGVKSASKFGFTAKIYKAGFYVDDTSASAEDLIAKQKTSHLFMRFVFQIGRDDMVAGWVDAFGASCVEKCQINSGSFKKFTDFFTVIKLGDEMEMTFKPKGFVIVMRGSRDARLEIDDEVFARDLLRVFIGPKVLDSRFKAALLGQSAG